MLETFLLWFVFGVVLVGPCFNLLGYFNLGAIGLFGLKNK